MTGDRMVWKPIGPGGGMFRARRPDGRKSEVFYEPNGTWIANVEREPSIHAGLGPTICVGVFKSRQSAMAAATGWKETS